jgi:hypothetical protein
VIGRLPEPWLVVISRGLSRCSISLSNQISRHIFFIFAIMTSRALLVILAAFVASMESISRPFHLGRREAGGEAIALVEIDGGLPKTMLPEIRALEQVVRADALHFALDI